jgi:ribose transport system substrate-binding protein
MKNLFLLMTVLALIAGCGGQQSGGKSGNGVKEAAPDAGGKLEIAVIPKSLSHQFWLTVRAGAEAKGEEAGADILWQGTSKETEVARQINIVQDMINRKVDALVLAACDENALIQTVEQALGAGIPVITIDSGVKSDKPFSFVATDNIAGAEAAADKLADLIGGAGKVGLIPFVPGAATSELREEGFREGIKKYPDIELAAVRYSQSDVAEGMNVTQDMLTSHPDLKGIFAANESGAIGAAQAIKAAGKSGRIKLVAFDASEEQVNALKEGVIQALIVQNPFNMGYLGVQAALDAIAGKEVEKRIDTGVTVVTAGNINEPEIQKILNPL